MSPKPEAKEPTTGFDAPQGGGGGADSPRRWRGLAAVAVLSLAFVLMCADSIRSTSAAYDEPGFMVAGYSYLARGCPEVLTANFRLSQLLQALPLVPLRPVFPPEYEVPGHGMKIDVDLGWLFLKDPRNNPAVLLAASRAVTVGLALVLGWILFVQARRIFGEAGAVLTFGLYCCNPVVISNSSLATTDMPTTLAFVAATLALARLIRGPGWRTALVCGLATGCLLTTKLSGILIVPIGGALLALEVAAGGRRALRPGRLAAWTAGAAGVAFGVIWAVYGFRFRADRLYPEAAWTAISRPGAGLAAHALNACRVWRLLPQAYLYDTQRCLFSLPQRHAFLDGHYSSDGWLGYFPAVFAVKSPFAFLAALALALALGLGRVRTLLRRTALAPFLALGAVYAAAAVWSRFNIGIRHFLPVYPALFVLAGAAATLRIPRIPGSRWFTGWALTLGLVTVCAAETLSLRPNYLAYVNALGGGATHGYRFLADSSLDWGEYLPSVARWLAVRQPGPQVGEAAGSPVYFAYQGNGSPDRYGIRARLLPGVPDRRSVDPYVLLPGTYILSASLLESAEGGPGWGRWSNWNEATYQLLGHECAPLTGRPARPDAGWEDRDWTYDLLRFGRLCAFLRGREPDARITPAVLVFELSQTELDAALRGPPPELAAGGATP